MRAAKGNLGPSSRERSRELESALPMRAVKDSLAVPLRAKLENRKTLARANGTSRRASGWAGDKEARSGRTSSPPSREKVEDRWSLDARIRGSTRLPFEKREADLQGAILTRCAQ